MEGLRFIKSMESLINKQTVSPGFYGRTSTAYLVTLVKEKTLNSLGLIFMMFIFFFPNSFVFGEEFSCNKILKKYNDLFRKL